MYCRFFDLSPDDNCDFVFQAKGLELNTKRYSESFNAASLEIEAFPVRTIVEEALNDLKDKRMDGQVMRFVKTENVSVGSSISPSYTAGCAARIWIDTSATDSDKNHFTKEQLEERNFIVNELYWGPFSLMQCHQIIGGLEDKISELGVIKLGSAYNVAQIIYFEPTAMASIKGGKLHINATKETVQSLIESWHKNNTGQGEALHEFLNIPFIAFSLYAASIDKCTFLSSI